MNTLLRDVELGFAQGNVTAGVPATVIAASTGHPIVAGVFGLVASLGLAVWHRHGWVIAHR